MEFANRSPGGSSQHQRHGTCPYHFAQTQHGPHAMPPSESFHGHAFGWGLPGQQQPAPYHQWPAPPPPHPPATLEIPPSSQSIPQLRVPSTAGLEPYQFLPGTLPPPHQHQHQHQHQQHHPTNFRPGPSADASYGSRGAMPPAPAPATAAPSGTPLHHHAQTSRLPGPGPTPPSHSHMSQPPHTPHIPTSLQSQEQTQSTAPPQQPPSSNSNQAAQHHPPPNPPAFSHNQTAQNASHQAPGGHTFSSSSADTPSLLSQQHQHIQNHHQRYQGSMSSSNPPGPGGGPSHPPAHADSAGQYHNAPGQAAQEQRQQRQQQGQPHDPQAYRHSQPPHPNGVYHPLNTQPVNIPPQLAPILNPNHLQHHYGHEFHGMYSENIPPPPANQRDLPRVAPPNVPPTAPDNRRRTPSTRPTRRSGAPAAPTSAERDRDVDDESSSASSPASSVDQAVNPGAVRHAPNDRQLRAAQLFRGAVSSRKVASSTAISSLLSVDLESLSEAERTCVICYNDFGAETPEGVREAPLRIPKCKHVFGDHCIKKWFEESDSCPYCRTKVPSEVRFVADARALMELMRSRGGTLPTDANGTISQEAILRLVGTQGIAGHDAPSGNRRSPPSEGEYRRRIRARYSGTASSPRGEVIPGGGARPSSFSSFGTGPPPSNHSPPSRDRHPLGDYNSLRAADREREWAAMNMARTGARQSQPRAPPSIYNNPYAIEQSALGDPSGRLPMPGYHPPYPQQQNSQYHAAPGTQPPQPGQASPFSYGQTFGLRAGHPGVVSTAALAANFSAPTNGVSAAEANAPAMAMDTDIPMPDRDSGL